MKVVTARAPAYDLRSRGTSMVDGTRITCQEVVEVVTDYLEGPAAFRRRTTR
jgi:hypothetical protein